MRFLRSLRNDADRKSFSVVAAPGEWLISAAFMFADREPAMLIGKDLAAFRSGFLGTRTFGWSSRAEVAEIAEGEYADVLQTLARHFMVRLGAPDQATAAALAAEECQFVGNLCDRPTGTVLAVERNFGPQGIVERFQTIAAAD